MRQFRYVEVCTICRATHQISVDVALGDAAMIQRRAYVEQARAPCIGSIFLCMEIAGRRQFQSV